MLTNWPLPSLKPIRSFLSMTNLKFQSCLVGEMFTDCRKASAETFCQGAGFATSETKPIFSRVQLTFDTAAVSSTICTYSIATVIAFTAKMHSLLWARICKAILETHRHFLVLHCSPEVAIHKKRVNEDWHDLLHENQRPISKISIIFINIIMMFSDFIRARFNAYCTGGLAWSTTRTEDLRTTFIQWKQPVSSETNNAASNCSTNDRGMDVKGTLMRLRHTTSRQVQYLASFLAACKSSTKLGEAVKYTFANLTTSLARTTGSKDDLPKTQDRHIPSGRLKILVARRTGNLRPLRHIQSWWQVTKAVPPQQEPNNWKAIKPVISLTALTHMKPFPGCRRSTKLKI